MPEAEVKKEEQTVDIDTSGPDVDINLPEEKDPKEVEVIRDEKQETKEEKPVEEKQETKVDEKKEELEQYSEGVKKRIAKLT